MLSKTGIHAVRAVVALAELPEDTYAGAGSIAETIKAPRNYLGKLLQLLARDGIVESQKGLGGGFRLARQPEEIKLLDIVEPIEHVSRWNSCILGRDACSEENPCAMHNRWKVIRDAYLELLNDTTIADLIKKPETVAAL